MNDIDKRLDEILENVMSDATLWYIGRISEKEYWKTHNTAKQAIKQLMANEFDKMAEIDDRLNNVMVRIAYSDGYEDGKSSKTR